MSKKLYINKIKVIITQFGARIYTKDEEKSKLINRYLHKESLFNLVK